MLVYHIRTWVMFLTIVLVLWAWWRMSPPRPRVFVLVGITAALALPLEVYGYLSTLEQTNNSLVYNAFTYLEFLLTLVMLRGNNPRLRAATVLVAVLGTGAMLWDCSVVSASVNMLIEGIVVMAFLLALLLSYALWHMANTSTVALYRVPEFWLFMGMLLYFGGLPPVVAMARFVYAKDSALVIILWTIVPVLCTLRYLLAAYACLLLARHPLIEIHE